MQENVSENKLLFCIWVYLIIKNNKNASETNLEAGPNLSCEM
jgi:hypothetical protein